MADVFISYKSERRAAARHLADVLKANGYTVWFDYDLLKGEGFRMKLDAELREAMAVVVLWCTMSVDSEWVDREAGLAEQLKKLVPAKIEDCDTKLAFHGADTIDLRAWDGSPRSHVLDPLLRAVGRLVGRPPLANWEALSSIDDAWRHYGSPSLAHFALGRAVELTSPGVSNRTAAAGLIAGTGSLPRPPRAAPLGWMAAGAVGTAVLGSVAAYYAGVPIGFQRSPTDATGPRPGVIIDPNQKSDQERRADVRVALATSEAERAEAERKRVAALEARIREQDAALAKAESERKQQAEQAAAARRELEARQKAEMDAAAKRKADEEAARRVPQPGQVFRDCNDGCPEMVVVPAGSFTMGSPANEQSRSDDEGPQRNVTIRQPFAVGKFEVTFAEWEACVSGGGCVSNRSPGDEKWGKGRRPVINVSWNDAKEYVAWLSRKSGKSYRLLSEAEWEFAARAGTTTPFSTGRTITTAQANFDGNYTYGGSVRGQFRLRTIEVGSFPANPFDLHDMHGNVWEWCEDTWHPNYQGAPNDGSAWTIGATSSRVLRGGSWGNSPNILRSASRILIAPDIRFNLVGFRVARTLAAP